ncbi:Multidrug resistance-associated protein/mitoxantrone resistance protein, ABC superfamily [Ceraceosorus bombacis]|uniref:Multidrug resistance-associated protein/mitoxantrone resistance protein, ABC superfamily n=1 Tax=Ceraceosorus bombacis TaxID=401625 RepID=A0A0N7L8V7_9BASI|nr:Multidrug resistance-associated protein/mitoxantrone resistance protein, ABC superfamily [Ceraceosorus bombacis]
MSSFKFLPSQSGSMAETQQAFWGQLSSTASAQARDTVTDAVSMHTLVLALVALGTAVALTHLLLLSKLSTSRLALGEREEESEANLSQAQREFQEQEEFKRLNGEALDEEVFWSEARRGKLSLILTCWIGLVVNAALLGFEALRTSQRSSEEAASALAVASITTVAWIDLLVVTLQAQRADSRFAALVHIFSLSGLLAVGDILLLTDPSRNLRPNAAGQLAPGIWTVYLFSSLVVSAVAFFIAGSLRVGPSLVYSPKPGTIPARPVISSGNGGASIFSRLYFNHVTSICLLAWKKGSIAPEDLAVLDGPFRAEVLSEEVLRLWNEEKQKRKQTNAPDVQHTSTLHGAWPVFKVLLKANKNLIILQIVLAFVAGGLFYGPAYLTSRLLKYLETLEENETRPTSAERLSQGLVYCLGLFASIIVLSCVLAQCWCVTQGRLVGRLRVQITALLYTAALKRRDVSAASTPSASKSSEAKEADKSEGSTANAAASPSTGAFSSKGQVLTLATVDSAKVGQMPFNFLMVIVSPAELLVGGSFAIQLLGWAAVVGFGVSLAVQPLLMLVGKIMVRATTGLQAAKDDRNGLVNEAIKAIRMLKLNAWEGLLAERVLSVRQKELLEQRKLFLAQVLNSFIFNLIPTLITVVAYGYYTLLQGNVLTPSVGFTASAVLAELRWSFVNIPTGINGLFQSLVSLKRIAQYLLKDEDDLVPLPPGEPGLVAFQNASVAWPGASTSSPDTDPTEHQGAARAGSNISKAFKLENITVEFQRNGLNLICGRVGAGKTLALLSLLGECDVQCGRVICPSTKSDAIPIDHSSGSPIASKEWLSQEQAAYVPQSSFLINATIKDNILFGLRYVEQRYEDTIRACGLLPDLKVLQDGDLTEVGEEGVGLSGGQKARVSLARAVYSRAQVLLLDDCLSAVDAETAAHVSRELFLARGQASQLADAPLHLMADRTIILVSHQVRLVAPMADQVMVLEHGRMKFEGSSEKFLRSDLYHGLIEESEAHEERKEHAPEDVADASLPSGSAAPSEVPTPAQQSPVLKGADFDAKKSKEPEQGDAPVTSPAADELRRAQPAKSAGIKEEARAVGAVRWSIYRRYLDAAGGNTVALGILAVYVVAGFYTIIVGKWLQFWTQDSIQPIRAHSDRWWLWTWTVLYGVQMFLWTLRGVLYLASLRASKVLFKALLTAVLGAPLRFHESTPKGRILNRFGEDVATMDNDLSMVVTQSLEAGLAVVIAFIGSIIGGGAAPLLVLTLVLSPLFVLTGVAYSTAARDVRRLASTSTSPLVTTFADLISGAAVIRSFGACASGYATMLMRAEELVRFNVWAPDLQRWVGQVFSILSATLLLIGALATLINPRVSAAQAGFAFSFLINVPERLIHVVFLYATLEQRLVAVERVVEWADLPKEAPAVINDFRPPSDWPAHGQVSVRNLGARYALDLPFVLKGLSFDIPAGTKLGVVGSTGSGKSTLASCFFRLIEASEGSILIDGLEIGRMGLKDLRSKLNIVPQDPDILSGPLRNTIDPNGQYDDEALLAALRTVRLVGVPQRRTRSASVAGDSSAFALGDQIGHDFSNLDSPISENGSNLSSGQRQLLCLARAVLWRSKLILFDEATSSIDEETDTALQDSIRTAFKDSTTITIAHRLRTVIRQDLLLVLDKGKVDELDTPHALLQNRDSRFYRLCRAAGRAEFNLLQQMAEEAHLAREKNAAT